MHGSLIKNLSLSLSDSLLPCCGIIKIANIFYHRWEILILLSKCEIDSILSANNTIGQARIVTDGFVGGIQTGRRNPNCQGRVHVAFVDEGGIGGRVVEKRSVPNRRVVAVDGH